MLHSRLNKLGKSTAFIALLLTLSGLPFQGFAQEKLQEKLQEKSIDKPLLLEVFVNDEPTKLVASFKQNADGNLSAKGKELRDVGIEPHGFKDEDTVPLESLKGVRYSLDVPTQTLRFTASDEQRVVKSYQAQQIERNGDKLIQDRNFGAVMNYSFFAASAKDLQSASASFSGVSANFDARVFGPLGTFAQSGLVGNATNLARPNDIRLDSTWSYSSEETMMTAKAGDFITGGLAWTRPIRLGGGQLQRNFGLRSDLITTAMPTASGTAVVPSTVDVYVNNVRTYSQDVPSGPFRISNLPVASNNGTARIVVSDVNGRRTETTQNFLISPNLLAKDTFDFSVDAGYARYDYGLQSFSYSNRFVGLASGRYGLSDDITLEGHAEASAHFGLAGAGIATALDKRHLLTLAGSFSNFEGNNGAQTYASYETSYKGFSFGISSQRTFRNYYDLAAVTAKPAPINTLTSLNPFGLPSLGGSTTLQNTALNPFALSLLPMKAIDRVTIGIPLDSTRSSLNIAHVHMLSAENVRAQISSASFSTSLNANTSFFTTAFMDNGDRKNYGVFAGLSVQLNKNTYASLGISNDNKGSYLTADVVRPQSQDVDTWGYRIRDMEGVSTYRAAQASYRSKIGLGEVTVSQQAQGVYATAYVEGAISTAGGGVFATNRVDDGFAVVKTGHKDAEIFHENRAVGKTDSDGRLLITNLRSNETNRVTINPNSLPITAAIDTTKTIALPKDRGAVVVDFGVIADPRAATVSFVDRKGKPIAVGATGTREDGSKFIVGHEGKTYLQGLKESNEVVLTYDGVGCSANFNYHHDKEKLVKINHVTCQ